MEVVEHRFAPKDLVAGHLALDLVNTVTARNGAPKDWLLGYGALLDWARLLGRFLEEDLERLASLAEAEPEQAKSALRRLKALRELLHQFFQDRSRGEMPAGDDLRQLQRHWKDAAAARPQSGSHLECRHQRPRLGPSSGCVEAVDLLRSRTLRGSGSVTARTAAGCSSTPRRTTGAAGAHEGLRQRGRPGGTREGAGARRVISPTSGTPPPPAGSRPPSAGPRRRSSCPLRGPGPGPCCCTSWGWDRPSPAP